MLALMDAGFTDTIFGQLYQKLFKPDSPECVLVPVQYPDVFDVIRAIHSAEGIAVLAHPETYNSFELLDDLIPCGLDGVEVWHARASESAKKKIYSIAEKCNLLKTGGTDFHGMYTNRPMPLGTGYTSEYDLKNLLEYKQTEIYQHRKNL